MSDLAALAALARDAGRLGLDTEFMTEGRYFPLLCLVQVSVEDASAPDGVRVVLLDPLTEEFDVAPLAEVLADPDIEVILHAARQDVAILRRTWRTEVRGVFDTQVAAGFAGFSAQAGYNNLLGEAIGVSLAKSAGFTRWDVRPLTEEQTTYAAGDVLYLPRLADELQGRLRESGRLEWVRDECRPLETASDERDPEEAWRRLPRVNQLSNKARAVAKALAAWRERTAASEDRPLASVLADAALVEIARRQPADTVALAAIRGVHPPTVRRRGDAVVQAVREGQAAEPVPRQEEVWVAPDARDAPVAALAEALARQRAIEAGLAYEL
ncbi:MAG: Ribonuclease, partial [Solirubrobacterales bacterium]|nr:Ribonuclease [Solirubrobacterales bacterium]